MRSLLITGFVLFLIGCGSFEKEVLPTCPRINPEGQDLFKGEVTALQNGTMWSQALTDMHLYAVYDNERGVLDLLIDVTDSEKPHQEHLYIAGIPTKEGRYSLPMQVLPGEEQRWFFFTILGGDVLVDSYFLDASAPVNEITLESINASECSVEGRFELTVIREESAHNDPAYPDKIEFKEGRFQTHLVVFE